MYGLKVFANYVVVPIVDIGSSRLQDPPRLADEASERLAPFPRPLDFL
jgi:hypothetical protein